MATDPDRDLKYPNSPTSWPDNVPVNADATNTDIEPLHIGDFDATGSPVENYMPAFGPVVGDASYVYDNEDGSKNQERWRSASDGQPTDPEDMAPLRADDPDVEVVGITLDPSGPITLEEGATQVVEVVFDPTNATDPSFSQVSGSASIASTSDNGDGTFTVTAVAEGTTTVTVTASGQTAELEVTVTAAA